MADETPGLPSTWGSTRLGTSEHRDGHPTANIRFYFGPPVSFVSGSPNGMTSQDRHPSPESSTREHGEEVLLAEGELQAEKPVRAKRKRPRKIVDDLNGDYWRVSDPRPDTIRGKYTLRRENGLLDLNERSVSPILSSPNPSEVSTLESHQHSQGSSPVHSPLEPDDVDVEQGSRSFQQITQGSALEVPAMHKQDADDSPQWSEDDGFMPNIENHFKFKYGSEVSGRTAQDLDDLLTPPDGSPNDEWKDNHYIRVRYRHIGDRPDPRFRKTNTKN